jgi:hypothetical protein
MHGTRGGGDGADGGFGAGAGGLVGPGEREEGEFG